MQVVNFSRYSFSYKTIRRALQEFLFVVLVLGVISVVFFSLVVYPAKRLTKVARLNRILEQRCLYLENQLVKLEAKKRYWLGYYNYFVKRNFSGLWNELWAFLESSLPRQSWIETVEWRKYGDGRYKLVIIGKVLVKSGESAQVSKTINEISHKLSTSALGKYIDSISVDALEMDNRRGIMSYVISLYPKDVLVG